MSERRHVPEPGELIYSAKPSWAPAFFALGAVGMVCGIFAAGFALPPVVYAVVGALIALGAFRSLVRGAIHDYFRLPRRQRVRSAALPVEQLTLKD